MEEPEDRLDASEITDIIPFNEFGDLAELDFVTIARSTASHRSSMRQSSTTCTTPTI